MITAFASVVVVLGTIITITGPINAPNCKLWEWLSKAAEFKI